MPAHRGPLEPDDLIDSRGVAELLGLSHVESVSLYLRKYPDMPRPWARFGGANVWLRADVEEWVRNRLKA